MVFNKSLTIKRKEIIWPEMWRKSKILRKAKSETLVIGSTEGLRSHRCMIKSVDLIVWVCLKPEKSPIRRSDTVRIPPEQKTMQARIPAYQKVAQAQMAADVFW